MAQYSRFSTFIAPITSSEKNKAYTMLVLSIGAIIFFVVFAIRPTILTIVSLQHQIDQANGIDAQLTQKIRDLDQAQQILDQIGPQKGLLDAATPADPNVSQVLYILETKAAQSKVKLGQVQFHALPLPGQELRVIAATGSATMSAQLSQDQTSQPTASQSATTAPTDIPFSLTVTGSISGVSDFLHQLTLPRRLLVIHTITYEVNPKDQSTSVSIDASTYQGG